VYVGRDFFPADADDSIVYAFDFVNDVGPSEKLISATWQIIVVQGSDPLYTHRLQGSPFILATSGAALPQATMQRIGGLQPGVTYCVRATIITNLAVERSLHSHIYGEAVR
jgi:hypothetical protein